MIALLLLACAGGPAETGDTGAGACADAPVVTYDNFGKGFLTESCQSCHASTSPNRNGAPESVVFDTEADVAAHADTILLVATGDAPRMPPEGGVSDDDRYLLEVWLTCYR